MVRVSTTKNQQGISTKLIPMLIFLLLLFRCLSSFGVLSTLITILTFFVVSTELSHNTNHGNHYAYFWDYTSKFR